MKIRLHLPPWILEGGEQRLSTEKYFELNSDVASQPNYASLGLKMYVTCV